MFLRKETFVPYGMSWSSRADLDSCNEFTSFLCIKYLVLHKISFRDSKENRVYTIRNLWYFPNSINIQNLLKVKKDFLHCFTSLFLLTVSLREPE